MGFYVNSPELRYIQNQQVPYVTYQAGCPKTPVTGTPSFHQSRHATSITGSLIPRHVSQPSVPLDGRRQIPISLSFSLPLSLSFFRQPRKRNPTKKKDHNAKLTFSVNAKCRSTQNTPNPVSLSRLPTLKAIPQKPKYSHRRYLLSYGLRRTIAPTTIPSSLSLRRSPSSQIGAIVRLVRSSPPNFRSRPDRSPPFSVLRSARTLANRSDGGG